MSEDLEEGGDLRENASATESSSVDSDATRYFRAAKPDQVLQSIVDLINHTPLEFGMTLTVDGFLVSGTVVSGKTFFAGLSLEMGEAFGEDEDARRSMENYFAAFGQTYSYSDEELERNLPIYLHLREARFFHNGGQAIPTNRGLWWRGRLEKVSGFSMGTLAPAS